MAIRTVEEGLVKVLFDLAPSDDGSPAHERMWAEDLGAGFFLLRNVPFYAFGVAEGDMVTCVLRDGAHVFQTVVRDGGNGVVRVYFRPDTNFDPILAQLKQLGCTFERSTEYLYAFTVPDTLSLRLNELASVLNESIEIEAWEYGKQPLGGSPSLTEQ
ncbi:MAG TPA: DUF4265 domain-containing protein [Polyangiaceae bacterium]|nr:DUF4265 domain-containing protein [Polyangiaceae bacterium]